MVTSIGLARILSHRRHTLINFEYFILIVKILKKFILINIEQGSPTQVAHLHHNISYI